MAKKEKGMTKEQVLAHLRNLKTDASKLDYMKEVLRRGYREGYGGYITEKTAESIAGIANDIYQRQGDYFGAKKFFQEAGLTKYLSERTGPNVALVYEKTAKKEEKAGHYAAAAGLYSIAADTFDKLGQGSAAKSLLRKSKRMAAMEREHKEGKLEKAAQTAMLIGIPGAVLLLTPTITGDVIGASRVSWFGAGVVLLVIGLLGVYLQFLKK